VHGSDGAAEEVSELSQLPK